MSFAISQTRNQSPGSNVNRAVPDLTIASDRFHPFVLLGIFPPLKISAIADRSLLRQANPDA